MVARFAIATSGIVIGGVLLVSCTYSKADAPVPSRVTNAVIATGPRPSVVGTLPPITATPAADPAATTAATVPPTPAPTEAPPEPPSATAAPRPTAAAPPKVTGPVTVQAGAFTTRAAAEQAVVALGAKGFGGFAIAGDGP